MITLRKLDKESIILFKAKIPLSDVMLEDLVLALDHDMNDELDYRELARGMGLWKKERREARRRMAITGVRKTPSKFSVFCETMVVPCHGITITFLNL